MIALHKFRNIMSSGVRTRIRKATAAILTVSMVSGSLAGSVHAAPAFEGHENEYYELCSSSTLSIAQKRTCRSFNKYLQGVSDDIKDDIDKTEDAINETNGKIDDITNKINETNAKINELGARIQFLQNSIDAKQREIAEKREKLKNEIYANQTLMNAGSNWNYLFGASSLADFFSRASTLSDLTSYQQQLIDEITEAKKQLIAEQDTVNQNKLALEQEQQSNNELQAQLQQVLSQQKTILQQQQDALAQNEENKQDIANNMAALSAASAATKVTGVTKIVDSGSGASDVAVKAVNLALSKQGSPYVWGAAHSMNEVKNPNQSTFDCSGLINWAYYQAGHSIGVQSTKYNLASYGTAVSPQDMKPGDIILFSSDGQYSGVHHVGMYIGNGEMVHAPHTGATVTVVSLNNGYWQKQWYTARRIV